MQAEQACTYTSLQVLLRYIRVNSIAGKESRNYYSDTYVSELRAAASERKAEDARDAVDPRERKIGTRRPQHRFHRVSSPG